MIRCLNRELKVNNLEFFDVNDKQYLVWTSVTYTLQFTIKGLTSMISLWIVTPIIISGELLVVGTEDGDICFHNHLSDIETKR